MGAGGWDAMAFVVGRGGGVAIEVIIIDESSNENKFNKQTSNFSSLNNIFMAGKDTLVYLPSAALCHSPLLPASAAAGSSLTMENRRDERPQ